MPRRIHHAQVPWCQGRFDQLSNSPLNRLWWIHCIFLLNREHNGLAHIWSGKSLTDLRILNPYFENDLHLNLLSAIQRLFMLKYPHNIGAKIAHLFREALWCNSIDPVYNMVNVHSDLLFEVSRVHATPSGNRSHRHPRRSSPRPGQQFITEKHG